jgi:hypothetical protein
MGFKVSIVVALMFTCTNAAAQMPREIPKKGLVGFWSFSGNAKDESGHNNDGKVIGALLTEDRFGNKNSAYDFNGTSNLIATKFKGVLGGQQRAVSFWMRSQATKPCAAVAWGGNEVFPNNGTRFNCGFNYVKPGPTIDVADAAATFEAHSFPFDNEWHHYVFQLSVPMLKRVEIYQDGNLLTHTAVKFYPNTSINTLPLHPVLFGCIIYPKNYSYFFKGQLDDIAIYDRALTQNEILTLYDAPNPNKLPGIFNWIKKHLILIIALACAPFLVALFYKLIVRREKAKYELQNTWFELENKLLAAQMDPHFIFNSLNAIQHFIIVNENDKAQHYLSKFSRLIRKLLEANEKDHIFLNEELELLERYLEIESLRFNSLFKYDILIKDLDLFAIKIPHFLIQPFVENAIWHGLLPKNGQKHLSITFEKLNEKTLFCSIDDNGVGRNSDKNKLHLENKKSLAIAFIQQRLQLLSKMHKIEYVVNIIDKKDEQGLPIGTTVNVTIPIFK